MRLYKLTDQNGRTQNDTQWGEGVTHKIGKVKNPKLRSSNVLHAYKNINLGLLLNPTHASILQPKLWEAEGKIVAEDYGKVGCFTLTTTRELSYPEWYADEQKRHLVQVQFAVLCAEAVIHHFEKKYPTDNRPRKAIEAAKKYLKTRNKKAADAAANAAYAAAYAANAADAAANAAANAAAYAANAANAANAAYAAANAAYAAANAAYAAAYAANAANAAANAAAYAANAAAYAANAENIDFCSLADLAVKLVEVPHE